MNLDLRPLTVSEFLDRTFSIYRHRFLLFVALMSPQAVLSLVAALAWGWASASFTNAKDFDVEKLIALVIAAGIGGLIFTIGHWILYVLGVGATTAAVSDLYGRMTPDIGSAYRAAARRLGPLLWLTFLMAVRIFGVLTACLVVPGLLIGLGGGLTAFDAANRPVSGGDPRGGRRDAHPVQPCRRSPPSCSWACATRWRFRPWCSSRSAGGEAIRRSIRLTRTLLGRAFLLMICAGFVELGRGDGAADAVRHRHAARRSRHARRLLAEHGRHGDRARPDRRSPRRSPRSASSCSTSRRASATRRSISRS